MTHIPAHYPSEQTEAPVCHAGRPVANIDQDQVRRLAGLQLSVRQIAGCIGVSRRTMFNRMKTDPNLRAAYQLGISEAILKAAEIIMGAIEAGDVKAAKYFLRTRAEWVDPLNGRSVKGRTY
jgi:hypothetical protein